MAVVVALATSLLVTVRSSRRRTCRRSRPPSTAATRAPARVRSTRRTRAAQRQPHTRTVPAPGERGLVSPRTTSKPTDATCFGWLLPVQGGHVHVRRPGRRYRRRPVRQLPRRPVAPRTADDRGALATGGSRPTWRACAPLRTYLSTSTPRRSIGRLHRMDPRGRRSRRARTGPTSWSSPTGPAGPPSTRPPSRERPRSTRPDSAGRWTFSRRRVRPWSSSATPRSPSREASDDVPDCLALHDDDPERLLRPADGLGAGRPQHCGRPPARRPRRLDRRPHGLALRRDHLLGRHRRRHRLLRRAPPDEHVLRTARTATRRPSSLSGWGSGQQGRRSCRACARQTGLDHARRSRTRPCRSRRPVPRGSRRRESFPRPASCAPADARNRLATGRSSRSASGSVRALSWRRVTPAASGKARRIVPEPSTLDARRHRVEPRNRHADHPVRSGMAAPAGRSPRRGEPGPAPGSWAPAGARRRTAIALRLGGARACAITGPVGAVSVASSAGRRNGTSAPSARDEAVAISSSSVLTSVRRTSGTARAAAIECPTSGTPPSSLRFLPGRPRDPPRAGITARIRSIIRILLSGTPASPESGTGTRPTRLYDDGRWTALPQTWRTQTEPDPHR